MDARKNRTINPSPGSEKFLRKKLRHLSSSQARVSESAVAKATFKIGHPEQAGLCPGAVEGPLTIPAFIGPAPRLIPNPTLANFRHNTLSSHPFQCPSSSRNTAALPSARPRAHPQRRENASPNHTARAIASSSSSPPCPASPTASSSSPERGKPRGRLARDRHAPVHRRTAGPSRSSPSRFRASASSAISLTGAQAGNHHRPRAHQGQDPQHLAEKSLRIPRHRPCRHRRRFPGPESMTATSPPSAAVAPTPNRHRHVRCPQGRHLRNLHRRRWRLHRRPPPRPQRQKNQRNLLRRNARAGQPRRQGHAGALGRVRQKIQSEV